MEFPDHIQRVISEKEELDEKAKKLFRFMDSDVFKSLDQDERSMMHLQLHFMNKYSEVLGRRINRAKYVAKYMKKEA